MQQFSGCITQVYWIEWRNYLRSISLEAFWILLSMVFDFFSLFSFFGFPVFLPACTWLQLSEAENTCFVDVGYPVIGQEIDTCSNSAGRWHHFSPTDWRTEVSKPPREVDCGFKLAKLIIAHYMYILHMELSIYCSDNFSFSSFSSRRLRASHRQSFETMWSWAMDILGWQEYIYAYTVLLSKLKQVAYRKIKGTHGNTGKKSWYQVTHPGSQNL